MNTIKEHLLINDKRLYLILNAYSKSHLFALIMRMITHLGDTSTAIIATIFAFFLEYEYQIPIGMTMLYTMLVSQILVQMIKRIVNRKRPYKSISIANVTQPPACVYSFPSGHTASAFAIAFSFTFGMPSLVLPLMVTAFIVGMSRIILGYHYPTDVLIGMVLAYLSHQLTLIYLIV